MKFKGSHYFNINFLLAIFLLLVSSHILANRNLPNKFHGIEKSINKSDASILIVKNCEMVCEEDEDHEQFDNTVSNYNYTLISRFVLSSVVNPPTVIYLSGHSKKHHLIDIPIFIGVLKI